MRKNKTASQNNFSILTLDDDPIITSTLQSYFQRSGYHVDVESDPLTAIERIRSGHYDILLLDFLMTPICGDQVVAEIRQFNREIFIILLTGHKSMAPPIKTIRELDIQGYYEKSDRFDQLELLVESCAKSITQMRTIRNYQQGLSSVMNFLPHIYHLQSPEAISDDVLQAADILLHPSSGFLYLSDGFASPDSSFQSCLRSFGNTAVSAEEAAGLLKQLTGSGQMVLVQEDLLLAAILNMDGAPAGVLGLRMHSPAGYEQLQLLEIFTKQVSTALHNSILHTLLHQKNDELTTTCQRLHDSYMEVIRSMRLLVDTRDIYTRGHSDRVSLLAADLAHIMGKDQSFCERVRVAGLFHDIGKVGVPDDILLKPGRLTNEEYAVIQRHPEEGAKILSAIHFFADIAPIVRAHHERYDGTGYPDSLKGEAIPEEARIITLADSFDAMTSTRHYREGLALEQAVEQIRTCTGTQFDPAVADAFLRLLAQEGPDAFTRKYQMNSEEAT